MRLLLVEDDNLIAEAVSKALTGAGYLVERAVDGETAWFKGDTEDYALIVLDLGLPGMDGLAALKRWRAQGRQMPVLILTARSNWSERVEGIDAGADDYLPKPFRMEELLARVRALLRRAGGHGGPILEIGRLSIDPRQMRVSLDGVALNLTLLEYRLLDYLAHQHGRVVTSGELIDQLYGSDESRDGNALEALVMRLRRKIGADLIETRRGFGYVLAEPAA